MLLITLIVILKTAHEIHDFILEGHCSTHHTILERSEECRIFCNLEFYNLVLVLVTLLKLGHR